MEEEDELEPEKEQKRVREMKKEMMWKWGDKKVVVWID